MLPSAGPSGSVSDVQRLTAALSAVNGDKVFHQGKVVVTTSRSCCSALAAVAHRWIEDCRFI
jgi:hypothetical protein